MNKIYRNKQLFCFILTVLIQIITVFVIWLVYSLAFQKDGFLSEDFACNFSVIFMGISGLVQIVLISYSNYLLFKEKTLKTALLSGSLRNFPVLIIGVVFFYGSLVVGGVL